MELYSRNRNNVTASYPELSAALAECAQGTDMILDGEIVAPDPATGAPSFPRLQQRMHLTRPTRDMVETVPVQLFRFCVQAVNDQPSRQPSIAERLGSDC
ncbi:ATP-dependent DNA ligase [Nocardia gipuzkoensis]